MGQERVLRLCGLLGGGGISGCLGVRGCDPGRTELPGSCDSQADMGDAAIGLLGRSQFEDAIESDGAPGMGDYGRGTPREEHMDRVSGEIVRKSVLAFMQLNGEGCQEKTIRNRGCLADHITRNANFVSDEAPGAVRILESLGADGASINLIQREAFDRGAVFGGGRDLGGGLIGRRLSRRFGLYRP